MDSVRARWPILVYAFMVWTVFGSENTFPAIEFSIGKRAPTTPSIVTLPAAWLAPAPTVSSLSAAAPTPPPLPATSASPSPPASDPVEAQPATPPSDGRTTALSPQPASGEAGADGLRANAGRSSAESQELAALRQAEESFSSNTSSARRPMIIPRPGLKAPPSCQARPADPLASREWSQGVANGWPADVQYPSLPIADDRRVGRYIDYFTSTPEGRKTFATWLRRSGKYRDVFGETLRQRRLPIDLAAVAFVESGLWPTAVSKAGATGLWQFMPETARAYGLEVRDGFDERRSIWRSTEAAADHLKDLFERLGSWELALAAYNMGHPRLSQALQAAGTEDFWSVCNGNSLPRETILYVPKVLAVAVVLNNLSYFAFDDVEPLPALDAAPLQVPPGVPLSVVARATGATLQELHELNPDLPGEVTPNLGRPINVYVPQRGVGKLPRAPFEWGVTSSSPVRAGKRESSSSAWLARPGDPDWFAQLRARGPVTSGAGTPRWRELLPPPGGALGATGSPEPALGSQQPLAPDSAPQTEQGIVDWVSWGNAGGSATRLGAAWHIENGRLSLDSAGATSPPGEEAITGPGSEPADSSRALIQYRVMPGDSLWSIAKARGTSEKQIAKDNRIPIDSVLNTGRLLELRRARTLL